MAGLYVIIDPEHCRGRDPLAVTEAALRGGCAALQLRTKALHDAARLALTRAVAARCRAASVPFWVNDRVDMALLADADGLHLGQTDLPLAEARKLFGDKPIGLSAHNLEQARHAVAEGADLVGVGPVFATRSKRDPDPALGVAGLRALIAHIDRPVAAIGGIELGHAREIAASGAAYAAVISAVCGADDPEAAARELREALA